MGILYIFADVLYFVLYHVVRYRKQVVRQNLQMALPERSKEDLLKIEKRYFRYLASLIFEVIKMASISKAEVRKRFTFKNTQYLQDYFDRGESILICSAHYGNWEWGTLSFGLEFPTATHYPIYKPLSNKIFDQWFKNIRSRFGNQLIAMRQTLRALNASKGKPSIFSFGTDQAPARDESHYWTSFLHQTSSIQLGLEKIALKTNRPVIYLKVKVLKRGYYEVDCVPLCLNPAETAAYQITEMHTRFLETIIRNEPEYWLWSHKRWKYKPQNNAVTSAVL